MAQVTRTSSIATTTRVLGNFAAKLFTAVIGDLVRCDPTNGDMAIRMPVVTSANKGGMVAVANVSESDNAITLTPVGLDTINGAHRHVINAPRGRAICVSDGSSDFTVLTESNDFNVRTVTDHATLDYSHDVVEVDASSKAITITLPLASARSGVRFDITKVDPSDNAVTVVGGDFEAIILCENESITVSSNGTVWRVI